MSKPEKTRKNPENSEKSPKNPKNLPARFARRLGGLPAAKLGGYFPKKISQGVFWLYPPWPCLLEPFPGSKFLRLS